jgi:hypothetical protein
MSEVKKSSRLARNLSSRLARLVFCGICGGFFFGTTFILECGLWTKTCRNNEATFGR